MDKVPTLHIPMKQDIIKMALENDGFKLNTKKEANVYIYKVNS